MKPSRIDTAPAIVREWLDREIVASGFADFDAIAQKARGMGKNFSRSSIHRYATKLKKRLLRAQHEVDVLQALGADAGYLVRWAKANPDEAARLAVKLRLKEAAK